MSHSPINSSNPTVTVIIVTHNSAHCIRALAKNLQRQKQVICVDNASSDDTVACIRNYLPQAKIIEHNRNLGFGAANNVALAQVYTTYALLLNPDCEITAHDINAMTECAERYPDAAMIVPQLMDSKLRKSVNYSWVKHYWVSKGKAATGECCVGFATGAALLIHMQNTRQLGYFDERFFLYYEDDDLCNKYFYGKKAIILAPHIQVKHSSRGSVKTNNIVKQEYWRGYHHAQSKVLITHKYQGAERARRVQLKTAISGAVMAMVLLPTFNIRLAGRMAGRFVGMCRMERRFNEFKSMGSSVQVVQEVTKKTWE